MRIQFTHTYNDIISLENLLEAWQEFLRGKKSKPDVQEFERHLMRNIISLHQDLVEFKYRHSTYKAFNISDPKPRNIHKATVRDRLLHHAVYRILYPYFDKKFITDSYSCRINKGTHRALNKFRDFGWKVSKNNTRTCWVLKCDIRKFFASVDHQILLKILHSFITDKDITWLVSEIVGSFTSGRKGIGLPLGNLTSQLFVNIYMNEFDQFMKHQLKVKYYIRYADDFVVLSNDKDWLLELTPKVADFLSENLKLALHPNKVSIKTLTSGIDFLGWIHFSDHRTLRTATKRRMFAKLAKNRKEESVNSYLGLLSHGNACKLQGKVKILAQMNNDND